MFAVFLLALLAGRYGYLQLYRGKEYGAKVRAESSAQIVAHAPRGHITDCAGRDLAVSLMMKSLFIDPNHVVDAADVARKLSPLIGVSEAEILRDIAQGGGFVWVKHFLPTNEVAAVHQLIRDEGYNCLGFNDELKRSYPNDRLAANVLGFVGVDDVGLEGIEQAYDSFLKGTQQAVTVTMDNARGYPILDSLLWRKQYSGDQCKTVQLTLDTTAQYIVEEELDTAFAATKPQSITAIAMNPTTGEVLAMATRPSYDPNDFAASSQESWRNRGVGVVYEPGSTFKSITAAAALQEQLVSPDLVFFDAGFINVSDRRIQNWNGESNGYVTFADIVKKSLNTCFAQIGLSLGASHLVQYAKLYGFGVYTGIELPGEEQGILYAPDEMRDSDIATMAIGQGIAVTPLQVVNAMSAIANGGQLMRPYIVKSIVNVDGSLHSVTQPLIVHRTIDADTNATLVSLLEQVVADGGGRLAQVTGYRVAGKTGTAEKPKQGGLGYMDGHYIASFCGFAPVENPRITLLVMIDDPTGGAYYGGQIAAPVAGRIFARLLRYYKVPPSTGENVPQPQIEAMLNDKVNKQP